MSVLRRWTGTVWEDVTNNLTNSPTANGAAYGDGTVVAFTGAGTTGQVLTATTGSAPTWTTPAAGEVIPTLMMMGA